jgi:A/G-specific adenine glycosylase
VTHEQQLFVETVWEYYRLHSRHDLPWRLPDPDGSFDPYKIMVSEAMLQQTQVPRVIPKFAQFLAQFPTSAVLAASPLYAVLTAWSGLGYNRRAKFLWQAARMIQNDFGGGMPHMRQDLQKLPGIGSNTAGAIAAYAFNNPEVFIETNIRTVFIYHFFAERDQVSDVELAPLIKATLDMEHPRDWYWALMDYGTFLKQTVGNLSRASKTYAKQSTFTGSKRQIRGQVLKLLTAKPHKNTELVKLLPDERLPEVLHDLLREGMIVEVDGAYSLAGS